MEAAFKLSAFLRREFGLSPSGADAELRGGVLTVRLTHALTPVGRVVAQSAEGEEALQKVYCILHEAHQRPMEALISRIMGAAVRGSRITVDVAQEDILVCFRLDTPACHDTAEKS